MPDTDDGDDDGRRRDVVTVPFAGLRVLGRSRPDCFRSASESPKCPTLPSSIVPRPAGQPQVAPRRWVKARQARSGRTCLDTI